MERETMSTLTILSEMRVVFTENLECLAFFKYEICGGELTTTYHMLPQITKFNYAQKKKNKI